MSQEQQPDLPNLTEPEMQQSEVVETQDTFELKPDPSTEGREKAEWYFIYGQDEQVGPITWTDLKQRAGHRVVTEMTPVYGPGMADWRPARELPGLLGHAPVYVPQINYDYYEEDEEDSAGMGLLVRKGHCPLAYYSMFVALLGGLGCAFPPLLLASPIAVGMGIWGLIRISRNPKLQGKRYAIWGIGLGLLTTLLFGAGFVMYFMHG